MWHSSARIDSPDVIKGFRVQVVKFHEQAKQAVAGIHGDSQKVMQWLRFVQIPRWQAEDRKRADLIEQAKSAYRLAKDGENVYGKTSCVDEMKALKKAQLRKAESEQKLASCKKWLSMAERETENQMGPVNNLSSLLEVNTPRALAQLDHLIESLQEYLRAAPPGG